MVRAHPPAPLPPISNPSETLRRELALALDREAPAPGERWLVAFSGGPDSTALAAALAPLARERRLGLLLVHLDHGIDAGSAARATRAAAIAAELGLPFRLERREVPCERRRGESLEVAARRIRYEVLGVVRAETGATRILTAHQRDDQVETVLLRLLSGSGLAGLAGIPERRGVLLRPLLRVSRAEISAFLAEAGLEPVDDPTNRDLSLHRNFLRHALLPQVRSSCPDLDEVVLAVARRAAMVEGRLHSVFQAYYGRTSSEGGVSADSLLALPAQLRVPVLRWVLRSAGVEVLPSLPSMKAFVSGLAASRRGVLALPRDGRSLVARAGRIALVAPEPRPQSFSYTFPVPGAVEVPEIGQRVRIRRTPVEPWMFRGEAGRTGLAGSGVAGFATLRSRRPGDRLRPLGGPGERKLKDLLVDRGVPAAERDRLPLLEVGGRIAWVPGVTIDEAFRLGAESECWVAELEPMADAGNGPRAGEVEGVERKDR